MKLFDETKNKYFDIIADLIFYIYKNREISLKELNNIMPPELNENIELKNSILNQSDSNSLFILNEKNNMYSLSIDSAVPVVLSHIEKTWLKYILNDNKSGLFLNKETIDKLANALEKYEDIFSNNIVIQHKNRRYIENYDELKEKIQIVIKAIKNNSLINYSYKTKSGDVLNNRVSVPYKIEYSLKKDLFYLISFSTEEKRPIKSILENINNLKILEVKNPISKDQIKKSIKAKKCDKHIILQIENVNNTIERTFLTFSSYSTDAKYVEDKDIHELKIYYYSFEEKEIINKIFSLGKGVIVKSPNNIRSEIINRIESTLLLYE